MPKITIITSAYNAENYLEDCANSVLSQSFSDFKWVLINDGSSDNTASMIDALAKNDARIVPVHQENKGLALSKNVGLEHVDTQYFCFLDSDDLFLPGSLEHMVASIEKCDADFVSFGHIEIPDDYKGDAPKDSYGLESFPLSVYENPWDKKYKKYPVDRNNWNKIYRSCVFKKVRCEDLRLAEDVLLGWRHRQVAGTIAKSDLPIIAYRISATGLSRQPLSKKHLINIEKLSVFLYDDFKDEVDRKQNLVLGDIAHNIYKNFIKKAVHTKDKTLQKEAKDILAKLYKEGIFKPKMLSFKRRMSLLLKGIV